ncbi:MAG: DUF2189 domain-containing protein [Betaproteobacteria bacterium]
MATLPVTPAAGPLPVRVVALTRPFAWLRMGWQDFTHAFGPSVLHGFIVMLGGLAILTVALHAWPILPGAFSGFVLIGPILATGLYELSRRRACGERPLLAHAVAAWQRGTRPLVWLGVLLGIAATLWVGVSVALVVQFVPERVASLPEFLRHFVAASRWWVFPLWVLVGALGAAIVFAATAVSVPLLLDRRVPLRRAILTSVRAVGDNPAAMALWALLIMALIALSMLTVMVGFVFAVPVVGHATWHAYRELIDADALPERYR